MGSKAVRWGVEIEAFGLSWPRVCNIVMDVTDDACLVMDRMRGNPLNWVVCHDGTIQGTNPFELRSPAFNGEDDGFARLRAVCKALRDAGAEVNKSCGLHVHHEASYGMKILGGDMRTLALSAHLVYAALEKMIDQCMPASRRGVKAAMDERNGRSMCRTLLTDETKSVWENGWQTVQQVFEQGGGMWRDMLGKDGHHLKLSSLDALTNHCTIEYRHHSGTLRAAKIIPWVRLTSLMHEKAIECALGLDLPKPFKDLGTGLEWLGAEEALVKYWLDRRAQVKGIAEEDDEPDVLDAEYQGDGEASYLLRARAGQERPEYDPERRPVDTLTAPDAPRHVNWCGKMECYCATDEALRNYLLRTPTGFVYREVETELILRQDLAVSVIWRGLREGLLLGYARGEGTGRHQSIAQRVLREQGIDWEVAEPDEEPDIEEAEEEEGPTAEETNANLAREWCGNAECATCPNRVLLAVLASDDYNDVTKQAVRAALVQRRAL